MDSQSFQTCLQIPVPQSVRELVQAPPICFPTRGDQETIEILEDFGTSLERRNDEIKQACSLATGFSDIVIILQRPRDRKSHKFDVSFEEFVQSSKTLKAVDELIRFASKGARSIYTVTVLNAFSYQPDKNNNELDQRCHEVLTQMLRAKKPRRIELPAKEYRLERWNVELTEGRTTVVLQSFHPSRAVNNADIRPEFRALLIYHFVAAFSELGSALSLPASAEEIRQLCVEKQKGLQVDRIRDKLWNVADYITNALNPDIPRYFSGFRNEAPAISRMREIKAFNRMYRSLQQLFGHSQDSDALAIARIVLTYWKQHFQHSPLYQQTLSWLILRGNEQRDWLAPPAQSSSNHLNLEGQFPGFMITEPSIPPQYKEINKKAAYLARIVFATVKQAKSLEPSLCEETAAVFKEHNLLIDNYIRNLSIIHINAALQIKSLVVCCEMFEPIVRATPQTLEREEFRNLFPCLRQLAQLIDVKEV